MKVILIDPPVFLLLQEKERVLRQETIDTSAQDRLMIPKEERSVCLKPKRQPRRIQRDYERKIAAEAYVSPLDTYFHLLLIYNPVSDNRSFSFKGSSI